MALRSAKFREVVQQVTAALEDRGISVPEPGVAEIVEERARQVAGEMRISVRQVLEYADPQQLASRIPALIGGLSEAGKLAAGNSEDNSVQIALDLVTHLATTLHVAIAHVGHIDADQILAEVERGVLIEAAAVMTTASERLSAAEWSTCQCGTEHGQGKVDKALARALLGRATEIDELLTVVLRPAIWQSFSVHGRQRSMAIAVTHPDRPMPCPRCRQPVG